MKTPRLLPAKAVLIGLFAAGLVGAGTALAITHAGSGSLTAGAASAAANASPSPAAKPRGFGRGEFFGRGFGVAPGALLGALAKETGLTPMQVITDIRNGQTLDAIAGSKDAKVKADALSALTTELDAAVAKGVFTKDQEQHLLADAKDAIDQVMAAKLGAAGLGKLGGRGGFGFGFGFGGPGHPNRAAPSPSPAA